MNGEDPPERGENIKNIIHGLERYNPEAVSTLEGYLTEQCERKFCDCNANRTLLKLYQLNPDRMHVENVSNILVKAMTQFPSTQFALALHLINPSVIATPELHEAVAKLRALNMYLESAQYTQFWAAIDGDDDLCADLVADIDGFEDLIRFRIAELLGHGYRQLPLSQLQAWLGLRGSDKTASYAVDTCGWAVSRDVVSIPPNPDNEAKKEEVREDVNVDMFSRVIYRAWQETLAL